MAHEITHLLQGVELHSDRGLMKAHWTTRDIAQMMCESLPLTPDDIGLIQRGLVRRQSADDDGDVVHPGPGWKLTASRGSTIRGKKNP